MLKYLNLNRYNLSVRHWGCLKIFISWETYFQWEVSYNEFWILLDEYRHLNWNRVNDHKLRVIRNLHKAKGIRNVKAGTLWKRAFSRNWPRLLISCLLLCKRKLVQAEFAVQKSIKNQGECTFEIFQVNTKIGDRCTFFVTWRVTISSESEKR
jgi:hypothetical protein